MRKVILLLLVTFSFSGSLAVCQEKILPADLPPIGSWLLYENGNCANWLGKKYHGKTLREPVNVIIIDAYSASKDIAIARVMKECKQAGYEEEYGHSAGYCGFIDNVLYQQIPNNKRMAFADHDFFTVNNHGRIIGPSEYNGKYFFIGAFSREMPSFVNGLHHSFVSFNIARNDFCEKMDKRSAYELADAYYLGNRIDTDDSTTADHDGYALILVLRE